MKLFLYAAILAGVALAIVGAETDTDQAASAEPPSAEYLPPVAADRSASPLTEDGYRYKTVRRLKYRHRRAVSQEYLPPTESKPSQEYLPPASDTTTVDAAPVPDTKVADDGYRYKTVRRLRYRARHRRDVGDAAAPTNEYLPPVQVELAPELKTIVGDDGYQYQTVRRLKYRRHRRDASEVASDESASAVEAADSPAAEYLPPAAADDEPDSAAAEVKSADLAKDGYRYKTVRRIRYRYRH